MVQEDVIEVTRTLTPMLSIVRQYVGEVLCNSCVTSTDTSTQSFVSDKSVVSDDFKGDNNDTSAVPLGLCIV